MDNTAASSQGPAILRVYLSQADAHYAGGLVAGAKLLELFGDAITSLMLAIDGVEGLLAQYETVEFRRPVRAGDVVEVVARLEGAGRTSRKVALEASVAGATVCVGTAIAVARQYEEPAA